MAMRQTVARSSADRVGFSPVVPHATMPWLPESTCHSTSCRRLGSSSVPSVVNGVTIAVRDP